MTILLKLPTLKSPSSIAALSILTVLTGAVSVGCNRTSAVVSTPDAATDLRLFTDGSGLDTAADSIPGSDGPDGNRPDATSACPEPLAQYACNTTNTAAECRSTWADVLANPDCHDDEHSTPVFDSRGDCGTYHLRDLTSVDTGLVYFYDAASGALIAVYHHGISSVLGCVAGPAAGVSPDCVSPWPPASGSLRSVCSADGGASDGG